MRSNDSEPVSQNRNHSQVLSRRRLDERSRRCGASPGTRVRHDSNPLTRFRSNFIFYLIAARKDARTVRSSTPRLSTKMPCRKRSSASAPSPRRRSVAWAIALKLVRYAKQDPTDCAVVLRLGIAQGGIRWTLARLEQWIMERCWPMGYRVPAPAEAAAPSAHTGSPLSHVPAWIAQHARGADD